ncbi:MAG: hypothetical protein RIQ72_190 [Candidatus Parcubacteria bacterium]|jgi:hypothetical protein
MRFILYITIVLSALFIFGAPTIVQAADMYLPETDGTIFINSQVYVRADDTLHIPLGSKVYFGPYGSIYAKGNIFIGLEQKGVQLDSRQPSYQQSAVSGSSSDIVIINSDSNTYAFQIDGGNLIAINIKFQGNLFLEGYRRADISISNNQIEDTRLEPAEHMLPIISVYDHTQLEVSHSAIVSRVPDAYIQNRPALIETFNNASSTFVYTKITSQVSDTVFNIFSSSTLFIDKTILTSCNRWFAIFNQSFANGNVNESICSDQTQSVFNGGISNIRFTYEPCCSSVLFFPGLQATRLYTDISGQSKFKVWDPSSSTHINYLKMSVGGTATKKVFAKDIMSELRIAGVPVYSIYTTFLQEIQKMKEGGVIYELAQYGYDWRKSPQDIVTNDLIIQVETLAAESYSGKVSIVAHSYGGLVTKELLKKLKQQHKDYLIDKVVLVAVPETGAPSALFALLHGYDLQILKGIVLTSATMASFVQYMPSIYHLLPIQAYARAIDLIFLKEKYAVGLPASISAIYNWFSEKVKELSLIPPRGQEGARSILQIKNTGDVIGRPYMLKSEDDKLKGQYVSQSATWQSEFTSLNSTYRIWSIAGVGIPTLAGMKYDANICTIICPKKTVSAIPTYSIDGDGTVILDAISNRLGYKVLFNLESLNISKKTNIKHVNILESKDLLKIINQILVSGVVAVNTPYIIDIERQKDHRSKIYQIILDKDMLGGFKSLQKTTGKIIDNGQIKIIDDIPGSSVDLMGDQTIVTSLTVPDIITVSSSAHVRSSFSYTVSEHPVIYTNESAAKTEIQNVQHVVFKNIIIPAGSTGYVDTSSQTVTIGSTIYHAEPPISTGENTQSGTTTMSTATTTPLEHIAACRTYIQPLVEYIGTVPIVFDQIQNISLKNKYQKEYSNIKKIFQALQQEMSRGNCLNTKQSKYLQQIFEVSLSAEQRLSELGIGYTSILSTAKNVSIFPFNLLPMYKVQTRKSQTEVYLREVKDLFIFFARLNAHMLEFSERYGSISN